jgi:mono/diheme cytochrome c family protein
MDAIIAYMRKLGTDIPIKKAEAAASSQPVLKNPYSDLASIKAEAEALYKQHCISCHPGKISNISAESETELFNVIAKGVEFKGMPGYGASLDEQKIWKLVTFLKLSKQHD